MNTTNTKTAENAAIDINPIPYLTWTWLKINKDSVSYDFNMAENQGKESQLPSGITVSSGKSLSTSLAEPEFSIGEEAVKLISNAAAQGKIYTIEKNADSTKPLIIRISVEGNSATHQIIHAKAGSDAKVIIIYDNKAGLSSPEGVSKPQSLSGVITKVYAEDDAKLHITKVQLCGKTVNQIDDTAVVCGERAKVSLTQIELGGAHIDAGFHATLDGYQSSFYSDTAYICQGNQYLDMNQVAVHKGKKTVCDMKTHGTAKDEATKTYRGTIDMVKG